MSLTREYKLVLANGVFKSGSTWLRDIALNLIEFDTLPPEYATRKLSHWINVRMIARLLEDKEKSGVYLSKTHIFEPALVAYLLKRKDVRILNITRDIRDVIVSHFYHFNRERSASLTFSDYYWKIGRYKAWEIVVYDKLWSIESENLFVTRFEDLKLDYASQVDRLARFLGRSVSPEEIESISKKTSLKNLMKQRNEQDKPEEQRFFRKGIVGDWKSHLSEAEERDLQEITDGGFGRTIEKLRYFAAFPLRRAIFKSIRRE